MRLQVEQLATEHPDIDRWSIESEALRLLVLDYGVRVQRLEVLVGSEWRNVVLGFDRVQDYLADTASVGAVVGRCANRIRDGAFHLNGTPIQLETNHGRHHLHGGTAGFAAQRWSGEPIAGGVRFRLEEPDGYSGYPGRLAVTVDIEIIGTAVRYTFRANSDRDTIFNPSCHSYFNLAGTGYIHEHHLEVRASRYLPTDDELLPTGDVSPVEQTPLDLRSGVRLGDVIPATGGLDHCYVLDPGEGPVATLAADDLAMTVTTTEPGLQVYTANGLPRPHTAVCLETQHFPDAPNHPQFPSVVLHKGDTFDSVTTFGFSGNLSA